jgi:SET domain-containing protein
MANSEHKFYWLSPKVGPAHTGDRGEGFFAHAPIVKDERILIVGGYIMTVEEEAAMPGKSHDNGIQITEDLVICTTPEDEWAGINFLNHSCNPNSGFRGQIFLVAMRDIAEGEEVTIDYAMVLSRNTSGTPYSLECLCKTDGCRSVITDEDWRNESLQKKYKGYFQEYLEEKIDTLNHV